MWLVLSVGNGRRQNYFLTSCEFHCRVPVSGNFISLSLNFLLVPRFWCSGGKQRCQEPTQQVVPAWGAAGNIRVGAGPCMDSQTWLWGWAPWEASPPGIGRGQGTQDLILTSEWQELQLLWWSFWNHKCQQESYILWVKSGLFQSWKRPTTCLFHIFLML